MNPRIITPTSSAPFIDIVHEYVKHAEGRRTVVFCVTIEHARRVAEHFRANGITAETLLGTDTPKERAAKLARFNAGETLVLCGVNAINDMGLQAEAVIDMSPTRSRRLHWARCSLASKPQAIVLDMACNALRLRRQARNT